ncbi:CBN-SRE-38 protein [Caenorhabditis brenneri]|uniref:CBN-SRE-38 protein n=1 Tax=Caenorhabditis brenneri TaxID=135651 RepID=G0MUU8_CAEBE|nr:CBN-SRE-38 protein [Caenorhabditis brenneri]
MNIMKSLFLFQWFEAIIGKIIIIPYQIGVFQFCDTTTPYVSWWSDSTSDVDRDDIIDIQQGSIMVYTLITASFLVWHYSYSMIFGILNLGVERIFASIFLKDYESKPRLYIPFILLISTHLVTVVFSYLVLTNKIGFYIGTAPCFVNSGLTFMMFIIVLKVNQTRRRKLEDPGPGCDYSLSEQFQVKENYRALKLAKNLVIVVLGAMSVPCALLIMLVIGVIPSFDMLFIHIIENSIYL